MIGHRSSTCVDILLTDYICSIHSLMCLHIKLTYVYMVPLFFVTSATSGGILDRAIEAEDKKHGDFLRLVLPFCIHA